MTDKEEQAYNAGFKNCALENLRAAIRILADASGYSKEQMELAALIRERQDAINILRDFCNGFGDNDWPDNLYLPDIIEKHLGNYLYDL